MADRTRPAVDIEATCACFRVRITVRGTVRAMLMCSCEDCQKATGTGHSTFAIFDSARVTITGETKTFERPAHSGATFTQTFCPNCGTPIHGRSSRWMDALVLPVGLFGRNTGWYRPGQLIFSRSHRDWDTVDDDLPRYETYRNRKEI